MKFKPEEVLFSPTLDCNLRCAHCVSVKSAKTLSTRLALKFLSECKGYGIEKVGFTGGEPFLALDFLCAITRAAVKEGMLFDRIMTNGVWWKTKSELEEKLKRFYSAGYDGAICVSVDAFHKQDIKKLSLFIKTASLIWGRRDVVSIASVKGARDAETKRKLKKLFNLLDKSSRIKYPRGKPQGILLRKELDALSSPHEQARAAGHSRAAINIINIDLSPIGKAHNLKNPWLGGHWFKEDYCKGPGNVFYVMTDGRVKPCCGYATDMEQLTIGNIKYDSVGEIIKNAARNRYVFTVFNSGLSKIRKRLQEIGFRFPGKTNNHCYFCWYILKNVPRNILFRCLD